MTAIYTNTDKQENIYLKKDWLLDQSFITAVVSAIY